MVTGTSQQTHLPPLTLLSSLGGQKEKGSPRTYALLPALCTLAFDKTDMHAPATLEKEEKQSFWQNFTHTPHTHTPSAAFYFCTLHFSLRH